MAASGRTILVWTDEEVELLLNSTRDYKSAKYLNNVDWESCVTKYADIHESFLKQYPPGQPVEFPHSSEPITKAQMATKLKAVRVKYRKAMDAGRRSGSGRVVLLYFELCQEIWGGSPATENLRNGLETDDIRSSESPSPANPTTSFESTEDSGSRVGSPSPSSVLNSRRSMLQARLDGHRSERLKRKVHSDPAVQEDLEIKRRMLELAESSEKCTLNKLDKLTDQMDAMHASINEGLSMLKTLIAQHQHPSPYRYGHSSVYSDLRTPPTGFSQPFHYTPGPIHHRPSGFIPVDHSSTPGPSTPLQGDHPAPAYSFRCMLLQNNTMEEED